MIGRSHDFNFRELIARDEDYTFVHLLMSSVGYCFDEGEDLMDAVTALTGGGPSYLYLAIEALSDGSVRGGLNRRTNQNKEFRHIDTIFYKKKM